MTQGDIDRAVARATGETVGRVHQMGFTLVVIPPHPQFRRYRSRDHRSTARSAVGDRPFAARQAVQA
jgi:hypothetical protein